MDKYARDKGAARRPLCTDFCVEGLMAAEAMRKGDITRPSVTDK